MWNPMRNWGSSKALTKARRAERAHLGVETLEDRQLLSVTTALVGNQLQIQGSSAGETIEVRKFGPQILVFDNGAAVFGLNSPFVLNVKVDAGGGNDTVRITQIPYSTGNPSNDTIFNLPLTAEIDGGSGRDSLYGGWGNDLIHGGSGNDTIYGYGGRDSLYGDADNDSLYGGSGDDGLFGGTGTDYLYGESGADRYLLWNSSAGQSRLGGMGPLETQDSMILFSDTTSVNNVPTTLKVGDTAKTVTLQYGAKVWAEDEIEMVDVGLRWLHHLTGNTRLLKTNTGTSISFKRYGSYVARNATDGINDAEDLVANQKGPNFLAWARGGGQLAFTQHGIAKGQDSVTLDVVHEVGHNWDEESVFWGMFTDLSGWRPAAKGEAPKPGEQQSGNWAWFHSSSAEFYRTYSKWSPHEDWATTWEAYYLKKTNQLTSADATRLADKLDIIDAFVDSMKG